MKTKDIITGYFEAVHGKKDPADFIQLSYTTNNLVDKDLLKQHASLVKGKEIEVIVTLEYEEKVPSKRTIVHFTLNGEAYKAVLVKELKPEKDPTVLANWLSEEGVLGLNPFSISKI